MWLRQPGAVERAVSQNLGIRREEGYEFRTSFCRCGPQLGEWMSPRDGERERGERRGGATGDQVFVTGQHPPGHSAQ